MLKEYTYTGGNTSIRRKDDHNFRLMVLSGGKEKVMIRRGTLWILGVLIMFNSLGLVVVHGRLLFDY